jgi:hypothetical protein
MGPGRRGEEWDVAAGYDWAFRRVRLKGLARRNGGWRDLWSPGWGEGEYGFGCGVGRPAAALAFPFIRAMMQVLSSFDAFLIL